jgi:hypothetical protein
MNAKVKKFIASDKFIIAIFGVVIFVLILILVFVIAGKNQARIQNFQTGGITPAQSNSNSSSGSTKSSTSFNPFNWLFQSNKNSSQSGESQTASSTKENQTTAGTAQSAGATTEQGNVNKSSSGNSSQTGSSGTDNSNTSSDPNATDFQIVFTDSNGQEQTYTPPVVPPVQVTWTTYINSTYHFSIQYPQDWQVFPQNSSTAQGIILFAPGTNPQDPSQAHIGFAWSVYNFYPADSIDVQGTTTSPAIVTGVDGTIYTRGPIGPSYIVSIFPYDNGYFGFTSLSSNPTYLYIYQYMLQSLQFNQ